MFRILMTLFLALQMMLSSAAQPLQSKPLHSFTSAQVQPQAEKLWWGMLDPELSASFARIPLYGGDADQPILWNWSWRGFLAALFEKPILKEAPTDAPSV